MANGDKDEVSKSEASEDKVSFRLKAVLVGYLLSCMLLMVYLVYSVWAAEPKAVAAAVPPAGQAAPAAQRAPSQVPKKDSAAAQKKADAPSPAPTGTPQQPAAPPAPAPGAAGQPAANRPTIEGIEPSTIEIGSGQAAVSIHGSGFDRESTVTFNGIQRQSDFISEGHLVASLVMSDLAAAGPTAVRVSNKNGVSDGAAFTVLSASSKPVSWQVFGFEATINQDIRLILLVLITGALGACVASLQSLADYIGNERLKSSWVAFYLVRPPIGAGIAFVFYLVLRGGLASGAGFDPATVNPFGLTAVAALVGMFSDKAMLKLQEVFTTLFKADDTRKDKLEPFVIATATRLPDATANQDYSHKLVATGGTSPYTWVEVQPFPDWVKLDKKRGVLTGTPTQAKEEVFTVQVTDAAGTTKKREFKLTVK